MSNGKSSYGSTSEEKINEKEFLKSVFSEFDENKSGGIELKELIVKLEDGEDHIPEDISKRVFEISDKNHDGKLDFDEFQDMMKDDANKKVFSKYYNIYIKYIVPRKKHHGIQHDGKYEEEYTFCPPPIALLMISTLELTIFIISELSDRLDPIADKLVYNPHKRYEIWRYVTYMLVHVGYHHLIVNLMVQVIIGFPLESVHKGWRIFVVYMSGVIAGSLGTSITDPYVYLAGASGGVYALLTAHVGTILMNWKEMEFPAVQLAFFLLITVIDVGVSLYNGYVLNSPDNVGYVAHFSGALAGLLVGIWMLKNFVPSKKETYIWWSALTVYIFFIGVMILLNIFWTDHFY